MSTNEPPSDSPGDSAQPGDSVPPDDSAGDSAQPAATAPSPPPEPPAPQSPTPAPPASETWAASTSTSPAVLPVPPTPPVAPPSAGVPSAPDAWNALPPKPKRRLTWLWVLLGVLGLIAALVVVAVVLFVRSLAGPIDATNRVLEQIKAQDYAEAYRLSCADDRGRYTVEQYTQTLLDTVEQRGAVTSYDVDHAKVDGTTAEVRYDITFGGGDTKRYEAVARKQDGRWRACLFTN